MPARIRRGRCLEQDKIFHTYKHDRQIKGTHEKSYDMALPPVPEVKLDKKIRGSRGSLT